MLRVLFTTSVLATAACAGTTLVAEQAVPRDLTALSARLTGCEPDSTRIEDMDSRAAPDKWIATCDGRAFYCFTEGGASCIPVPGP